jgi:membrane-associated phospholipid phosphatase
MYVMVYAVVPAGATVLALGNRADALDDYWLTVLTSELACFAMLPWLQTRPPRAIEVESTRPLQDTPLRRLNLAILNRGSIQVNTVPSGHAAGSFAVALAVASVWPASGAVFLALATGITIATVLGRYHYLADSVLGVLVAVAVWGLRRLGA